MFRMVRRSLVLFLFALSLRAQVVQLPPATLRELALAPDIIATPPHERRHARATYTLPGAVITEQVQVSAQVSAPALGKNFFGTTSRKFYPADAAGAVGPQHVVGVFNTGLFVFDRTGVSLSNVSLGQFWFDPTIVSGDYYDPRILYDKFADRWFLVALYDNNSRNSTLVVGVSATGDPTGSWSRYRIAVGNDVADFTRLGMSADRFIVSATSLRAGSLFWLIRKADAYSTLHSVATGNDVNDDFEPVTIADDSTTDAYLLTNDTSGLVSLWRFDSGAAHPTFIQYYSSAPWQSLENTEIGPQPASGKMDVGETYMQAAVGRAGVVWGVHMFESTTSPVHSSIRWWRIPLNGGAGETGTIDDPAAHDFYGFPSIAVNRLGGALISYSLFSVDRYPTAAYSYRDPSGVMSATGILKEGEAIPLTTRWATSRRRSSIR